MSTVEHVKWSVEGFLNGAGVMTRYRSALSIDQGKTDFRAFPQARSLSTSISECLYLLHELKFHDLSNSRRRWTARLIAYPTAFGLQMLNHRVSASNYPLLKRSIELLRDNLGLITFVFDLCIGVGITYYVSAIHGVGLLAGLTIELLDENQLLPTKVKAVWEKVHLVLCFTFLLGISFIEEVDLWDIAHWLLWIGLYYWETYQIKTLPPDFLAHRLTSVPQATDLVKKLQQAEKGAKMPTRIVWEHLSHDPKLIQDGSESIKIQEKMKELMDRIEWTRTNLDAFKNRLFDDSRSKERINEARVKASQTEITVATEITDKEAQAEFTFGATTLARTIELGQVVRGNKGMQYGILQSMLRSMLKRIEEMKECEDPLFTLAIEGADFCGAGSVRAIEEIFNRIVYRGKLPLKNKILHHLMEYRKQWFEEIYTRCVVYAAKLPKGIIDTSDIHFRNILLFYFENALHLHTETIKNDMNVNDGVLCDRVYRWIFTRFADYVLWPLALKSDKWYSTKALQNELVGAPETFSFNETQIREWWQEWIEKVLKGEDKDKCDEALLLSGKLFGEPLSTLVKRTSELNPTLMHLMLYDMHVVT